MIQGDVYDYNADRFGLPEKRKKILKKINKSSRINEARRRGCPDSEPFQPPPNPLTYFYAIYYNDENHLFLHTTQRLWSSPTVS